MTERSQASNPVHGRFLLERPREYTSIASPGLFTVPLLNNNGHSTRDRVWATPPESRKRSSEPYDNSSRKRR